VADAAIIEVPAMAGDPAHAAADGAAVVSAALAADGRFAVRRVSVPPFAGDIRAASREVCRRVATAGRSAVREGRWPLVLAGSCDVAPGVLAGIRDPGCGVIWIDAHADFNTPSSSTSGFWPGMTLAVVVGHCGDEIWSALNWRPVPEERVALFGVRSLSPPAERQRLTRSRLRVVSWRAGVPQATIGTTLDHLADVVDRVYVHLDLDALDPTVGSGVVDPPVPCGLTPQQLDALLEQVCARFAIAAATVATYTPAKDDGATLPVAVAAVKRLITR
jgi:arginase